MKNSRRYLISLLSITIVLAALMAVFMYALDPFNYFRWNDLRFFSRGQYFIPGIVRNYGADAYVIGSSMVQNTDLDMLRGAGYSSPVKLTKDGMTLNETLIVLRKIGISEQYPDVFVNLDVRTIVSADNGEPSSSVFKDYLYNATALDDWKHLYGYETWFRYGPICIIVIFLDHIGYLPSFLDPFLNINNIDRWYEKFISQFRFEVQVTNYNNNAGGTSSVNFIALEEQFAKVDTFIDHFAKYTQDWPSVTVGFAPYSALYWYVQDQQGIMDSQIEIKSYLIQRLLELENVKIADMQAIDEIADLNHYKDQTHFDLILQDMYTEAMLAEEGNIQSVEDIEASNQRLREIVDKFAIANSDWL